MSNKIIYFKIPTCNQSREQIVAKIAKIDEIIDSLMDTALVSVGNANRVKYEIDTGQTKQIVEFTTPKQVTDALDMYEKMRQRYQNKLIPRTFKLTDHKNFR